MGIVPVRETHDPRPTGKLFALRWKHEHLRMILLGAILSFAVAIMFMSLLHRAAAKQITIVDNGVSTVTVTRSANVQGFLEERNIHLGSYDQLSLSTEEPLKQGSHLVIDRAKAVAIYADGEEQSTYTTEHTVGEFIQSMNITLGAEDTITPELDTLVREGMTVIITRVHTEYEETRHALAYKVVEQQNDKLEKGKQKVVTAGVEGEVIFKRAKVYEDGRLVSQSVVEKTVTKPAVNQVIAIGTKKPEVQALVYNGAPAASEAKTVQLNGKSIKVKRTLSNVTLTAYHAGFASTGKKEGDPYYGITSSGTTVEEGRTIAVDPKVIPMGWWVYIDGIGLRRAEDTGSAIKGKKIDIYFDSEKRVEKFGKKRGYTVYVIGPVKPAMD